LGVLPFRLPLPLAEGGVVDSAFDPDSSFTSASASPTLIIHRNSLIERGIQLQLRMIKG